MADFSVTPRGCEPVGSLLSNASHERQSTMSRTMCICKLDVDLSR
jgi:hypothetical protein